MFGAGTCVSLYTQHFDIIAPNDENPHTPEPNDAVAPFVLALQSVPVPGSAVTVMADLTRQLEKSFQVRQDRSQSVKVEKSRQRFAVSRHWYNRYLSY